MPRIGAGHQNLERNMEPTLPTPGLWTSGLQDWQGMNVCCFIGIVVTCYSSHENLIHELRLNVDSKSPLTILLSTSATCQHPLSSSWGARPDSYKLAPSLEAFAPSLEAFASQFWVFWEMYKRPSSCCNSVHWNSCHLKGILHLYVRKFSSIVENVLAAILALSLNYLSGIIKIQQ